MRLSAQLAEKRQVTGDKASYFLDAFLFWVNFGTIGLW
jgi:hypothetical protein